MGYLINSFKSLFFVLSIVLLACPIFAKVELSPSGGFNTEPGKELNIIAGTSWHLQLQGNIKTDTNVKVFDFDLIDNSAELIQELKDQDKIVICYFSAGTAENFREGFDQIPGEIKGEPLSDFPNEFWLDIRDSRTRELATKNMDLALTKGCDGVDPDNVDAFINNSGFPLTREDQIDFNRFLATEAHNKGLSIALKNALSIIPELVDNFDFSVNEQCAQFKECDLLNPFIEQNKAVFQLEYKKKFRKGKKRKTLCRQADEDNRNLVFYNLALNGKFRKDCPSRFTNIPND